jgi:type III secretion system-like peptide-binding chaperone
MPGDVASVRAKVQQYLTQNFNNITIDKDSNFSLRNGSVRMFVNSWTRDTADWTAVSLEIPLLFEVKETPQVFEHIALHADDYVFGHLNVVRNDNGLRIYLSHTLLGDYLDEPELVRAVSVMLGVADQIDDELKAQFGGTRFYEED